MGVTGRTLHDALLEIKPEGVVHDEFCPFCTEAASEHEEEDVTDQAIFNEEQHEQLLASAVEKALEEVKDKLPAEKVADVEGKVKSLRDAIEASDTAAMATHSEALEAAMKEIAEAAYSAAAGATDGAPGEAASEAGAEEPSKGDDDVIDAEFEEVKEGKDDK